MRTIGFIIYPINKRQRQDFNPGQSDFKTDGSFLLIISSCAILDGYINDPKEVELI